MFFRLLLAKSKGGWDIDGEAIIAIPLLILAALIALIIYILSISVKYPRFLRHVRFTVFGAGCGGLVFFIVRSVLIFTESFSVAQIFPTAQLAINIAVPVIFLLFFLFKNKILNRNAPSFDGEYYRDIPEYAPCVAATLVNYYKEIKDKFAHKIISTLLDLSLKGAVEIERTRQKGKRPQFSFYSGNREIPLSKFERAVFDLLFKNENKSKKKELKPGGEISYKKQTSLAELNGRLRKETGKVLFGGGEEDGDTFIKSLATADFEEFAALNFFDDKLNLKHKAIKTAVFAFVISAFAVSFGLFFGGGSGYMLIYCLWNTLVICGLWLMAIKYCKKPLTTEGEDALAQILALKKFYIDFTRLKERETIETVIWEKHIVYASALGVADKIGSELPFDVAQLGIYDADIEKSFISAAHKSLKTGLKVISKILDKI